MGRTGLQPSPPLPSLLRDAYLIPQALAELIHLIRSRDRALAERHGISGSQWQALQALGREGPMTVTGLGACLHLEKSTVSRLADSLLKMTLIRKRSPLSDGRVVVLQPTESGLRLSRRILNDRTEEWLQLLDGMDEGSRADLAGKLRALLDEAASPQKRFR